MDYKQKQAPLISPDKCWSLDYFSRPRLAGRHQRQCPDSRLHGDARHPASRPPDRPGPVLRRGARPRSRGRGPRGGPGLRGGRGDGQGGLAAALEVRRARPTTSSPPPSARATWPATTGRSTATAPRTSRPAIPGEENLPPARPDDDGQPRRGIRRRGQAADHARHLRPLGRLRRPVLQPGPQGPPPDPQRLRRRLQGGRRPARPDLADRRPSSSASGPPTRWRCTCPTSTRSPPTSPASPA